MRIADKSRFRDLFLASRVDNSLGNSPVLAESAKCKLPLGIAKVREKRREKDRDRLRLEVRLMTKVRGRAFVPALSEVLIKGIRGKLIFRPVFAHKGIAWQSATILLAPPPPYPVFRRFFPLAVSTVVPPAPK